MAKVLYPKFPQVASGYSPPAGQAEDNKGRFLDLSGALSCHIPEGDFKLEVLEFVLAESEGFLCDCCDLRYAVHELWWLRKERFSNLNDAGAGATEQVFVHLVPPVVVRSCKYCLPRARILAEAKLRRRHLDCGSDRNWIPIM